MGDIIAMPDKGKDPADEKPDIWICACGCTTHFLLSDNTIECPSCGKRASGAWRPSGLVIKSNADDVESFAVHRPGEPADVRLARFKRAIDQDGLLAATAFNKDGRIITIIEERPKTDNERQWWRNMIESFRKQVFLDV